MSKCFNSDKTCDFMNHHCPICFINGCRLESKDTGSFSEVTEN